MNKTRQLRVCALYLTLGLPLGASCAREANTLESAPEGNGESGTGATPTATSGAGGGASAGKGGATGAFGGTMGKSGSSAGGATAGTAPAEGGEASVGGTLGTAGSAGSGGSKGGVGGSSGSGGTGGVPPDVIERAQVVVYYQTMHGTPSDGTIQMKLFILNKSSDPLPMANVKIRYWFTAEVTPELHQYYTGPEAKQPKAVFVSDGANSHALMTFGGGSIVKGGDLNASEIQLEMTNNTGKFNQSDDFSWLATSTSTPNDKITLYLDDVLVWGCEPSGACFDDGSGAGGAASGGASGSGGAP